MSEVVLAGAVRGLVSEGVRVANIVGDIRPELLALAVSLEGLEAMKEHLDTSEESAELENVEEEIYVAGLEAFGEVKKPPPCYSEAWKAATQMKLAVEPLDMNDEKYTNAFCRNISTLEMVSQGRCQRRIMRHKFQAKTAEEFVLEFDSVVNKQKGYKKLEREREEHMAMRIGKLAKKYEKMLAIIEVERLEGVKRGLESLGISFSTF